VIFGFLNSGFSASSDGPAEIFIDSTAISTVSADYTVDPTGRSTDYVQSSTTICAERGSTRFNAGLIFE
jgi:hypothetical protein